MKKYKVLWFDDECDTLELIKDLMWQNDIELIGFDNARDGIIELKDKHWFYDAVILDGKFFLDEESKGNSPDDQAFGEVAKILLELKSKNLIIPWFIFSGQISFVKEKNSLVSVLSDKDFAFGKVFDKNIDEDLDELCNEIKLASLKINDIRIKNDYSDVFELCTEKFMGKDATLALLSAIKLSDQNQFTETKDAFNGLRKIIELLFGKLNNIGLIPDEILNNRGWINQSSLFLAGKHDDYKWVKEVIHPTVSFLLFNILQFTQDASHLLKDNLRLKVDDFITNNSTPYLYRSTLNQLFDVLIWFKKFIYENPDKELNTTYWEKIGVNINAIEDQWIKGTVLRIADNGWGTLQPHDGGKTISILPNLVSEHSLIETQQIEVITKPSPDGTKTFIKEIRNQ